MNAESYLQSFKAALDTIVQPGFDLADAVSVLPSGRPLSLACRLQAVRQLDLERPQLDESADLTAAADIGPTGLPKTRTSSCERLPHTLMVPSKLVDTISDSFETKETCERCSDPK